ncbi:hypothetical protein [Streptacidiphilus anmyonensis]|uniref:hypothetical protein n=1 Tax=Streptacidiphilus anmyonensis TaxID=405782 RepID=UPI0005A6C713|nr:hypothetical protein [Streptacidiphilus anmyonensis]
MYQQPRWISDESRLRWVALDREQRQRLFDAARRGEPWPDQDLALAAVHWAWAVLGPPQARRAYPLGDLILRAAPAAMFENVFNGAKQHDMRLSVRRAAKLVERANLPTLEEAGLLQRA